MTYLEKLDSPAEVVAFLAKLEQEIIQQSQNKEKENKNLVPENS
jgi:hypothetical protein